MNGLLTLDATFCLHSALTLLYFLWQGLLLATMGCLAAWCMQNRSAVARHRLHAATLVMMVACLPATFIGLHQREVRLTPDPGFSLQVSAEPSSVVQPQEVVVDIPEVAVPRDIPISLGIIEEPGVTPPANLPTDKLASAGLAMVPPSTDPGAMVDRITRWTTASYLIGVVFMVVRMLLAFSGTQRLRRGAHRIDDSAFIQAIQRRAGQFRLRRPPLIAYCDRVAVPALVGLWRPMILLPTVLATGLTPEQLDLVIAHEMAHIRRWDNAWLLAQRMIESILFFHPAVWYVSRRLSIERELCCDEMVLGTAARRCDYAESLLRVVELTTSHHGTIPATATMTSPREQSTILVHRIIRILGQPKSSPLRLPRLWPVLAAAFLVAALLGVMRLAAPNVAAEAVAAADDEATEEPEPATERPGGCWVESPGEALSPFALLPHGGYIELQEVNGDAHPDLPGWSASGRSLGPASAPASNDYATRPVSSGDTISRRFRFDVWRGYKLGLECRIAGESAADSIRLPPDVRFFRANEAWETVFTVPSKMQTVDLIVEVNGVWRDFKMVYPKDDPIPVETAEGIELRWKGDGSGGSMETRAVVVDQGGQEIVARAEPGPSSEVRTVFEFPGMTLDRVGSWRLEHRYHSVITFRNVSLYRGHSSEPQTISSPRAGSLDASGIAYAQDALEQAQDRLSFALRFNDVHSESLTSERIQKLRQQRDRCEYALHRICRILADRMPNRTPPDVKATSQSVEVSPSERLVARLIAHYELYKLHIEALDSPEGFWRRYASSLSKPDGLGVLWHADCVNPAKEGTRKLGPMGSMLLADLAGDADEIFLRSPQGTVRYLQRIRVERECLKTCHVSKRSVFDVKNSLPRDGLEVGDIMALLSVEVMPVPEPLPPVYMEGAFASETPTGRTTAKQRVTGSEPVPAETARIRGRLVHGETGRSLSLAEVQALADDPVRMTATIAALSEDESIQLSRPLEFAADGSYSVNTMPGETTISFMPSRPWTLVDHPDGLKKTLSLTEGQDVRMDFWVVVKREKRNR